MQTLNLQLTLPEVNQLLDALGDKPYSQVYQLISKIQQQAETQLQSEGEIEANRPSEQTDS